ncbi:MAG: dihydrofolate reductase family protein [Anaerolineae bacterium]|nr:dihydrofolate reductase family protein [Anaerolineae bacterium]
MGKVTGGMTISLDGFVNDRNGSVARLYPNFEALGETDWLQESIKTTGAVLMGRHAYDMGQGDFTGYEYQVPIFVLTHNVPEKAAKGENDNLSFTFVTDGLESAVKGAKAAAGDKNVVVVGGASTIQQCLNAGLLDELEIDIAPVLLNEGLRLFEHLQSEHIELERTVVKNSPLGTNMSFRVLKAVPSSTQ